MENLYRAFELKSNFYCQWVLDFTELNDDWDWHEIIQQSLSSNPGASLKIKYFLFSKQWVASNTPPPFQHINHNGSLEDALLNLPHNLSESGPSCDVIKLTYTTGVAIAFRTLHSVMDGKGLWNWLTDCIKIINETTPTGHSAKINDRELGKQLSTVAGRKDFHRVTPLTDGFVDKPREFFSFTIPGTAKGLSKKLCFILRNYAEKHGVEKLLFLLPSDLRKYDNTIHSTGNLTGILTVPCHKDSSDKEISEALKQQIQHKEDAQYTQQAYFWRYFSVKSWGKSLFRQQRDDNYSSTAVISNIGDLDASEITIKGQQPTNAFCMAPYSNYHPLFIVSTSYQNQLTLHFAIPEKLQGNAEELVNFVKSQLLEDKF